MSAGQGDRRVDVKAELVRRSAPVTAYLAGCLKGRGVPERLLASMEYSLLAGGKRLRPVLVLAFAGLFGAEPGPATPFAAGLELIHTYSLIHDDLPCMDDDDLRRGKPSNHKQFDEATALLAGDALLTEAFTLMLSCAEEGVPARRAARAARTVAVAAGAGGMVGGQMLDMLYTARKDVGLDELRGMDALKTGALITAACVAGAQLAGADDAGLAAARAYGENLGVAFQIVDDVLDIVGDEKTLGKPVGSDERQGKTTFPSLLGLDESRRAARERAAAAAASLAAGSGPDADFLRALSGYVVERVN